MYKRTKLDRKAERAYNYFAEHQPEYFRDDYMKWKDLPEHKRKEWRDIEDFSRQGYAHYWSLIPRKVARELKHWNKLSEAERYLWRQNTKEVLRFYQNETAHRSRFKKWDDLSAREQHYYRLKVGLKK